ncbi:MAG: hypothetical protein ABI425_02695 [Patescibacteria group bacterium]
MPNVQDVSLALQKKASPTHRYFIHVLAVLFLIWSLYRYLFVGIPVVIDETIGKLIFFALPVWLYVILTQAPLLYEELNPKILVRGVFLGILFGGLFGFVSTAATWSGQSRVIIAPLFLSFSFWWQFFLGVLTAFWESIFFFGWIFTTTRLAFPRWRFLKVCLFNMLAFVLFHIPNVLIRFNTSWNLSFSAYFFSQLFLLAAFAVGQSLLFYRYRNLYLLTVTHAIWGIMLLVFGKM